MRKYFLTGCDKNTEWQLPWFVKNFHRHCDEDLVIADFGMSAQMSEFARDCSVEVMKCKSNGWFTKVEAMIKLQTMYSGSYCWLDTDCEVRADPSSIFNWVEPNKLTMIIDHPWSKRRPELGHWYNSGVVAFQNSPQILHDWYKECKTGKHVGDQEALHYMMGGDLMKKTIHISEAPHKFNVLRIDLIDETAPANPIIMHWTGQKGKLEIRRQMGL